jgi:hypothetical protein
MIEIFLIALSFTEILGYIGSLVVVSSFFMKDINYLRIVNIIGCLLFIGYGILLNNSIPIIFTNTTIVLVNLYYLIKARLN